jgi:hypothetical protein
MKVAPTRNSQELNEEIAYLKVSTDGAEHSESLGSCTYLHI